jgi:hypothetical protein
VPGWKVVATGAPMTVETSEKQSLMALGPVLVTSPLPAHEEDEEVMATVNDENDVADSSDRSRVLEVPLAPTKVTPEAVPGWKSVGMDADPPTWTVGYPPLPLSGNVWLEQS